MIKQKNPPVGEVSCSLINGLTSPIVDSISEKNLDL